MKPHIYTCKGYWYCSDGRWLGWSNTPQAAYANWKARGLHSCIHQRETRLQLRRRVVLAKLTADMRSNSR